MKDTKMVNKIIFRCANYFLHLKMTFRKIDRLRLETIAVLRY